MKKNHFSKPNDHINYPSPRRDLAPVLKPLPDSPKPEPKCGALWWAERLLKLISALMTLSRVVNWCRRHWHVVEPALLAIAALVWHVASWFR